MLDAFGRTLAKDEREFRAQLDKSGYDLVRQWAAHGKMPPGNPKTEWTHAWLAEQEKKLRDAERCRHRITWSIAAIAVLVTLLAWLFPKSPSVAPVPATQTAPAAPVKGR